MSHKTKARGHRHRRLKRPARLASAKAWLANQKRRDAPAIARSYRKRYAVDWACAIKELISLGVQFDPVWMDQLQRSIEGELRSRAARKAKRQAAGQRSATDSDINFAFIVGYTEGGVPYGVTWEEWEKEYPMSAENNTLSGQSPDSDAAKDCDIPF